MTDKSGKVKKSSASETESDRVGTLCLRGVRSSQSEQREKRSSDQLRG